MIYLNLGSNLPANSDLRKKNIEKAIYYLKKLSVKLIKISSFYKTPSYPDKKNPDFINICLKMETSLKADDFLSESLKIEELIGRKRNKKNEPRVCDIDIIDFNGEIIDKKNLTLPHPKLHLRNFVIYPLREIEPNWTHPISNKKIELLFQELQKNSHNEITRLGKSDILV